MVEARNPESDAMRRRKPAPSESLRREAGFVDKVARKNAEARQNYTANTQSSSESDSESSVVSSSSSDSGSTSSDSSDSESEINTLTTTPKSPVPIISRRNPPLDGLLPKSESSATTRNERSSSNTAQKAFIQSEPRAKRRRMESTTLEGVADTASRESTERGKNSQESSQENKDTQDSVLSKTETMAVFEDFSF